MDSLSGKVLPSVCVVLLLSSVNGDKPNCTDIELFSYPRRSGEGRVEICCDNEWGTVTSSDTGIDLVICRRYFGFGQHWKPNRTTEFGNGQGPVWEVTCTGQELSLQSCNITKVAPMHYMFEDELIDYSEFWTHEDDIGVKCQGQRIEDLSQMEKNKGDDPKNTESGEKPAETQINQDITILQQQISVMIGIDVIEFALLFAVIALCVFVVKRVFAANKHSSKENDQSESQAMLSSSTHVTVQAETTSQVATEGRQVDTKRKDRHGPALTEVNPVYDKTTEAYENPVLTELNPCYQSATEMASISKRDRHEAIELGNV